MRLLHIAYYPAISALCSSNKCLYDFLCTVYRVGVLLFVFLFQTAKLVYPIMMFFRFLIKDSSSLMNHEVSELSVQADHDERSLVPAKIFGNLKKVVDTASGHLQEIFWVFV